MELCGWRENLWADRHTDTQTDRQTKTDRHKDRQGETERDRDVESMRTWWINSESDRKI